MLVPVAGFLASVASLAPGKSLTLGRCAAHRQARTLGKGQFFRASLARCSDADEAVKGMQKHISVR